MAVYKTVTYTISNNAEGRRKVEAARDEINRIQGELNSLKIFNLLMTFAGLFHPVTSIASACFSGATTSYPDYLEKWEDVFTRVGFDMWKYRPEVSTNISYVKISYDLIGNAEKYRAGTPRYSYHKN